MILVIAAEVQIGAWLQLMCVVGSIPRRPLLPCFVPSKADDRPALVTVMDSLCLSVFRCIRCCFFFVHVSFFTFIVLLTLIGCLERLQDGIFDEGSCW